MNDVKRAVELIESYPWILAATWDDLKHLIKGPLHEDLNLAVKKYLRESMLKIDYKPWESLQDESCGGADFSFCLGQLRQTFRVSVGVFVVFRFEQSGNAVEGKKVFGRDLHFSWYYYEYATAAFALKEFERRDNSRPREILGIVRKESFSVGRNMKLTQLFYCPDRRLLESK